MIMHRWFTESWSDWEYFPLHGPADSAPAVCSWAPGRLDLFVRGGDNALWHKYFDGGWSAWESLGGILTSAPSAVSWGKGRIDVVACGLNNTIIYLRFDNGRWSGWETEPYPGKEGSAPVIGSSKLGRLEIFARDLDNALWQKSLQRTWSGWRSTGGTVNSDPAVTSSGKGRLDVIARGPHGAIMHRWFDGGWSNWEVTPHSKK